MIATTVGSLLYKRIQFACQLGKYIHTGLKILDNKTILDIVDC